MYIFVSIIVMQGILADVTTFRGTKASMFHSSAIDQYKYYQSWTAQSDNTGIRTLLTKQVSANFDNINLLSCYL